MGVYIKMYTSNKKILNNNVNRENLYRKPIKNMHKSLDLLMLKKIKYANLFHKWAISLLMEFF